MDKQIVAKLVLDEIKRQIDEKTYIRTDCTFIVQDGDSDQFPVDVEQFNIYREMSNITVEDLFAIITVDSSKHEVAFYDVDKKGKIISRDMIEMPPSQYIKDFYSDDEEYYNDLVAFNISDCEDILELLKEAVKYSNFLNYIDAFDLNEMIYKAWDEVVNKKTD